MPESTKYFCDTRVEIKNQVDYFLSCIDRKTLAINGPWGCGKTYFWKNYCADTNLIKEARCSYVSLFDIASLTELKSKILFSSATQSDDEWSRRMEYAAKGVRAVLDKVSFFDQFVKSDSIISAVEERFLKDCLVCLDDIERRSKNLDMGQLLGFVSVLREHHNCRIILILNEDQLNGEDRSILKKYRDKIIDMELLFRPSVRENTEIVFRNHPYVDLLIEVFERFGINNIRIMQKTLWRLGRLLSILAEEYTQAREEMSRQLAILCCLHYSETFSIDITQVRNLHPWPNPKDSEDENKQITDMLKSIGWGWPEYADLLIAAVLHEVFDEIPINAVAKNLQELHQDKALRAEIEAAFNKFNANFQGTIDEIRTELQNLLNSRNKEMSWNQLGQVLSLLNDLGGKIDVAACQEQWIEDHPDDLSDPNSLGYILPGIQGEQLKIELEQRMEQYKAKLDLVDCMSQVADKQSWGGDVSQALKAATKNDFINALKRSTEPNLLSLVRRFLSFAVSFGRSNEDWAGITERIRSALVEIAKISKLNRIRVNNFFGSEFGLEMKHDTDELADSDPNQREETGHG